jgi:hypothetical protein
MRSIIASGTIALAALLWAAPATARDYPWCYTEIGRDGVGPTCAYVSRDQCLMTALGTGGICEPNPWYRPAAEEPPAQPRPQGRRHTR